ncbi:hypothetical protein ECANGB1_1950 [Enterospora canceri]|uniref:Uncharacterized protein n=1 Tax=Enterospora canceri TaxID=1081671 RepID=A0A1Y1S599_9MICR|nr:hypothetical protein ECANGB1_1950 [Enterospora canceri]
MQLIGVIKLVAAHYVIIQPYVNTNSILSGKLTFIPKAQNDQGIWSMDFNGDMFRLRYKSKYLEPSDGRAILVGGDENMRKLAKTESLEPLLRALGSEHAFDDSSSSNSNSSTDSSDYSDKNKRIRHEIANGVSPGMYQDGSGNYKSSEKKRNKDMKKRQDAEKKVRSSRKNARANTNSSDPVVVRLLGKKKSDAAPKSSGLEKKKSNMASNQYDSVVNETQQMQMSGDGFHFHLIPVFHNSFSKKIIIRYMDSCLTSNMEFRPCSFTNWYNLAAKYYWHIYPTVNNTHLTKINDYLQKVTMNLATNKRKDTINLDELLAMQGMYDETKMQQSSSSDDEYEECKRNCKECFGGSDSSSFSSSDQLNGSYNQCGATPMEQNCMPMQNGGMGMGGMSCNGLNPNCGNTMDCTNVHNGFDEDCCSRRRRRK